MEILEKSKVAKDCLKNLSKCRDVALELGTYCLIEGGPYAERDVLNAVADCAEICGQAQEFIHRGSEYRVQLSHLCAEVCDDAADQCSRFSDDERMLYASMVIRDCAVVCRDMVTDEHFV